MKLIDADIVNEADETALNVIAYAPTLGWKDVSLSNVTYVMPPIDGIQDFILNGKAPTGIALQSIQLFDISAKIPRSDWIQGVRIQNSFGESLLVLRSPVTNKEPIGEDFTFIKSAGLNGDKLIMDISYGGGCRQHTFQLAWNGSVIKTNPPQIILTLSHNGNGDQCEAMLSERLQIDLSVIIERPQDYLLRISNGQTEIIAYSPAWEC